MEHETLCRGTFLPNNRTGGSFLYGEPPPVLNLIPHEKLTLLGRKVRNFLFNWFSRKRAFSCQHQHLIPLPPKINRVSQVFTFPMNAYLVCVHANPTPTLTKLHAVSATRRHPGTCP